MEKNHKKIPLQRIGAVLHKTGLVDGVLCVTVLVVVVAHFYWLGPLFLNCFDCMTEVAQSGEAGVKISRAVLAFLSVDVLFVCIFSLIIRFVMQRGEHSLSVIRLCVAVSTNAIAASLCAGLAVLWQVTLLFGALVCLFVAYVALAVTLVFFSGVFQLLKKET